MSRGFGDIRMTPETGNKSSAELAYGCEEEDGGFWLLVGGRWVWKREGLKEREEELRC